ncbi:hypothetical protein SKAU_G00407730 [Synaphobranchus kaupii]|uniref:Otoancorin n=1 Tax=Synaphobranchus kaupii TaxID=118154 RepID=A0A9Q1EAB0_SYNKA|nr:hypothetical protein SKAU_G00407730 [Synaphobranchus kaupii]
MCVFRGVVFLLLAAQSFTAMSQEILPYRNYSTLGFPPLPPGFTDVAKRLMSKCSRMGYPLPGMTELNQTSYAGEEGDDIPPNPFSLFPSILSSVPPPPSPGLTPLLFQLNDTLAPPLEEPDWYTTLTDRLMNSSDLLDMLRVMRNSTDDSRCFLRAFVAPLSWDFLAVKRDRPRPIRFRTAPLGGGAIRPECHAPVLTLPPRPKPWQLKKMMELLSRSFSSLSQDQRQQILRWVIQRVGQNGFNCTKEHCPPRKGWLKPHVMETMGRFLFLLHPSEWNCPKKRALLFLLVSQHCFHDDRDYLGKLGSLACFYDRASSLSTSLSKTLLRQLKECHNSGGIKLRKKLVMKVLSEEGVSGPSLQWVLGMGAPAVSALSLSQLGLLSGPALRNALPSLRGGRWKPAQARTLARKLLKGKRSVSVEDLLSMGSLARGVQSAMLRRVGLQAMLEREDFTAMSQELSTLQRAALLQGLLGSVTVSELVNRVSGPILTSLSLSALKRAGMRSFDQVEGQKWTRAQSAFLVRSILGKKLRPWDIRKLGSAVQGVTCDMIDSTDQTEVFPLVQALVEKKFWLYRRQVRCAAVKLFESLERNRTGYFYNITDQELSAIPTILLLYLPKELVASLPDSVCTRFLEKMSQADLSLLPLRSASRTALVTRALGCLKKNVSSLTPDDITSLGGLVLELQPLHFAALSPAALNASLLVLANSTQMQPRLRKGILKYLTDLYGEPSDWSLDTMTTFGPLLLRVNKSAFRSLTYKPWLKEALTDLLDAQPPATSTPEPEEFSTRPNVSALQWILFSLATTPVPRASTNQQRIEDNPPIAPTLEQVLEMGEGNLLWSPAQLYAMSDETFRDGVSKLGEVSGYTPQQLQALRNKTLQVWGEPGSLTEEQVLQLGCVTPGFSPAELQELNITSLDTLELLSSCDWEHSQSQAVLQGFMRRSELTVGDLGTVEVVGFGQFICGVLPQEVEQLSNDTCREALGTLGSVFCAQEVTERMKDKAVLILGDPANWTEDQVSILGNIIPGLTSSELQSLNSTVFSFISLTAIPRILANRMAALSVTQLEALGPDNAAMVTTTQLSALGIPQQNAVYMALGLQSRATIPSVTSSLPPISGTTRLGIVGNVVFWQNLLLLLIGLYIQ